MTDDRVMVEQPLLKADFRCRTCGYGVVRLQPPERCPMCAGSRWERQPQRHLADDRPFATPWRALPAPSASEAA